MIIFAVENGEGAVKLFQEDNTGQFVGKRERGEGNLVVGGGEYVIRKSNRAADEKGETAVYLNLLLSKLRQRRTGQRFPFRRQQDLSLIHI